MTETLVGYACQETTGAYTRDDDERRRMDPRVTNRRGIAARAVVSGGGGGRARGVRHLAETILRPLRKSRNRVMPPATVTSVCQLTLTVI